MNKKLMTLAVFLFSSAASAASTDATVNLVNANGTGQKIGNITITETEYGLLFTPHLSSLPAGIHGFHIHENGSCDAGMKDGKPVAALAAGGHLDPQHTNKHLGPYNPEGHLGDLPALYVNQAGNADYPVLAPRLKSISQVKGHAIMIHTGGDNHEDRPNPLGGGGARIACGVIK